MKQRVRVLHLLLLVTLAGSLLAPVGGVISAQEPGTPEPSEEFQTAATGVGSLRLIALDGGSPVDGVCFSINGDIHLASCTGSQGTMGESLVEGLAAGSYTVEALPPSDYIASGPQTVDVPDGETAEATFTLTYVMPTATPPPDTTAPSVAFTSPQADDTLSGTVTLTANADDPSGVRAVRFEYSTTPAVSESWVRLAEDTDGSDGWSAELNTTAIPNGSVTLRVYAEDVPGNQVTTNISVIIDNPVPDTTPPTAHFISPQTGATLAGTVTISAFAEDASGIAVVRFEYSTTPSDLASWVTIANDADGTDGWSAELDTTTLPDGPVTIRLYADDIPGSSRSTAINVFIDNADPNVAFDIIQDGDTFTGTVTLTANADDPSGVSAVRFKYSATPDDSGSWTTIAEDTNGGDGWSALLDTTALPNGAVTLRVIAEDTPGNTSTAQVSVTIDNPVAAPQIEVAVTASNDEIAAGATVVFDIAVTNTGDGPANDVMVVDTLPFGINWIVNAGGCDISAGTLVCNLGTLEAGGSADIRVTGATSTAQCGALDNTATVSASNAPDATDSASVTVTCPDLAITMMPLAPEISAGETASFTITVTNVGTGTAHDVIVMDVLPPGIWTVDSAVAVCDITDLMLECVLDSLNPEDSEPITVSKTTDAGDCGVLYNSATVMAGNEGSGYNDNNTVNAAITVNCAPDLEITVTAESPSVNAGDPVSFTFTITNNGPGPADNVTLSDVMPAGFTWSESNADCSIEAGVLNCDIGTLAPGQTVSVTVTATTSSQDCGTINLGSASVVINCPDVVVTKTANAQTVNAGDPVSFTIIVTNVGPGTAYDVIVEDFLPAGLVWTEDSANCTIVIDLMSCAYFDLPEAATVTLTIIAETTAEHCGVITNTAAVMASNEAAFLKGNNEATASIEIACPEPGDPPVTNQDLVTTDIGEPVTIYPLANDSDTDTPPNELTLALLPADGPSYGTVTLDPVDPTAVIYTPNPGFIGTDGFYYEVSDGSSSATGWVRITVVGPLELWVTILGPDGFPAGYVCYALYTASSEGDADRFIQEACGDDTESIARFSGLISGTYVLRGLFPPYGLETLPDLLVEVGADPVTDITVTHELAEEFGALSIIAVAGSATLNGACWQLLSTGETPSMSYAGCDIEDGALNGRTRLMQIEPGVYTLHQMRTPAGYAAPADQLVEIIAGEMPVLEVEHGTGDALRINTVHENGSVITGICASVLSESGDHVAESCDRVLLDGAEDGTILMPVLPPGEYMATILGSGAPEDYYLALRSYPFSVEPDGAVRTTDGGNTLIVTFLRGGELLAHSVDGDGQPFTGNTCFALYHANPDGTRGANASSAGGSLCPGLTEQPDGSSRLADLHVPGLAPGSYLLTIGGWANGFTMQEVPVTVAAGVVTEITITVTEQAGSSALLDGAALNSLYMPITTAWFGQTIQVTFALANTGNTTLSNLSLTSEQFGELFAADTFGHEWGVQPFYTPYTITAADAVRGSVTFTATLITDELDPIIARVTVTIVAMPNTPAETGVPVEAAGTDGATLTFSEVSEAGFTWVIPVDDAPELPADFSVDDALFFDIGTTSTFDGPVLVCIPYEPGTIPNARLLHYSGGTWTDITSEADSSDGLVCGITSHFSPFAITRLDDVDPPVITVPDAIVVEASSPDGTVVDFEATAVDAVSGAVDVTCSPASGTSFQNDSTTTVTCTAEDAAGNEATAEFTVTVNTTLAPTNKNQCKNGGWQTFNDPFFVDQGSCVSFVEKPKRR